MQLRPGSSWLIVYQITDPNDSTTYYPQAVIRNSVTGKTITTVNLSLVSSGRYSYLWGVPPDPSGLGTQIDITVTAYTDSGHSTPSPNYQIDNKVYLIRDYFLPNGGTADGTDYEEIERRIKRALSKLVFPNVADYKDSFKGIADEFLSIRQGLNILQSLASKNYDGKFEDSKKLMESLSNSFNKNRDAYLSKQETLREFVLTGIQNLTNTIGKIENRIESLEKEVKNHRTKMNEMPSYVEQTKEQISEVVNGLKGLAKVLSTIETVHVTKGLQIPKSVPQEEKPNKDFSRIAQLLS